MLMVKRRTMIDKHLPRMDKKKVLLVEISGIHYEVVYSHIKCLKEAGYHVTFVCYEDIKNSSEMYSTADKKILLNKPAFRWIKLFQVLKIVHLTIKEGYRDLIIATADSGVLLVRILLLILLYLPLNINVIRCIHNFRSIKKSFWDSRILNDHFKKIIVLNDYIISQNKSTIENLSLSVKSLYPVFFPEKEGKSLKKEKKATWICIPGKVNPKRRDYHELIAQAVEKKLDKRIKFILLGGHEGELKNIRYKIEESGISDRFITFDSKYVPQETFNSYVKESDFIMPLIHPSKSKYEKYKKYKISGAFSLAFGYRKALICEEEYKGFEDFDHFCIFYSRNKIIPILNRLPDMRNGLIDKKYASKKMSVSHQSRVYKDMIG